MTDNTYIFFLGRQNELSFVELEAVCASKNLPKPEFHDSLAILETTEELPSDFLKSMGGIDRIARVIATFPNIPTSSDILEALAPLPEKWMLGLSSLLKSHNTAPSRSPKGRSGVNLKKLAIELKKEARSQDSRLKFITPAGKNQQLNSAQVLFNKLVQGDNAELTFIEHEGGTTLVKTTHIQDITAYELRDTKRPARNPKSGMLPPKLAQIMINIAVGHLPESLRDEQIAILDPFCGSGGVLQEGWLMNYEMTGTDADEYAVRSSKKNLAWIEEHFQVDDTLSPTLKVHTVEKTFAGAWRDSFSCVVSEPYLGSPLEGPMQVNAVEKRHKQLAKLYKEAFRNMKKTLKKGATVAFLFPSLTSTQGLIPTPQSTIDGIEGIGYRVIQLRPQARGLLYRRPDALVARELILFKNV